MNGVDDIVDGLLCNWQQDSLDLLLATSHRLLWGRSAEDAVHFLFAYAPRRDYVYVPLARHDASLAALNLHLFGTLAVYYIRMSTIKNILTLMVERVVLRNVLHAPARLLQLFVFSELALMGHRDRMVSD